jgi:hypothetical protein
MLQIDPAKVVGGSSDAAKAQSNVNSFFFNFFPQKFARSLSAAWAVLNEISLIKSLDFYI